MPRKRGDTKQKILTVAASLIAQKGYQNTSTRDIARELQIASPSLYYHFESKGAILTALLEEPLAFMEQEIKQHAALPRVKRIHKLAEALITTLEFHHGILLVAPLHMDEISPEFKERVLRYEQETFQQLGQDIGPEHHLRIPMAIGAVEGVVKQFNQLHRHSLNFSEELRKVKPIIVKLVIKILLD